MVFRGFLWIPRILTELPSEKFFWFDPSPIEPESTQVLDDALLRPAKCEISRKLLFFKPIFCENFEIAAVQKDANLVEVEKCCQTQIFLQKFVLIQPRTSCIFEKLRSALLRPGRFDRKVPVGLPNVDGRVEILEVHVVGVGGGAAR